MLAVPQCLVVFVRMIVAIAAQFAAIDGQEAQRDAHNDTEDILGFKAKKEHGYPVLSTSSPNYSRARFTVQLLSC
jgi:hypothetical protein